MTAAAIVTPDRRVRIFVSSTLQELSDERAAARAAITGLRMTPVMFELGASAHPPRELYRSYLSQSDVFVGIYWQRYGWVAPDETVSGLEDEYQLAGDGPKLIYVKASGERDPRLSALLARVRDDDRAAYKPFAQATELEELLADDLAVLLTERFTEPAPEPAPEPGGRRAGRVPEPPSRMVGREAEVAAIEALLTTPAVRLVTLLGTGGIGKTRLVLHVAARRAALPDGRDSVWFVDLANVREPAQVGAAVAAALGIRPEGTRPVLDLIVDRLQSRTGLLVMDNVEQLLDSAGDLGRLLAACPGITALVTSRSVLHLRGEHEVTVGPLPVPAPGMTVEQVAASPSVQLFVDAARQVRPGFAVDATNATAVAELCRRLEGIPLAIELAAAQLRLLTPAALLRRVDDRWGEPLDLRAVTVDRPERQRTLRATVDWSYELLQDAERALLDRLSVFAGGWTLAGAEAVGAADSDVDVYATLSALVGHSLVRPDDRDPETTRFTMLNTIRTYAAERLVERGEQASTASRLAAHLRTFVDAAGAGLAGPDNREWAHRVDGEVADLQATLRRAADADDADLMVRLTAPLFTYWWSRGLLNVMNAFAEQAAALPSAAGLSPDAAALLLWARGMLRIATGATALAEPFLHQLLAAAMSLGDQRLRAHALVGLGLAGAQGAVEQATGSLDEAVLLFRQQGDRWGLAFALSARGQLDLQAGAPAEARTWHTEGLAVADAINADHLRAQLLDLLGLDGLAVGDVVGARDRFAAAAQIHARMGDQEGSAYCLDGFAAVALAQGRPEVAARLLAAGARARRLLGVAVWPGMQVLTDLLQAAVLDALTPAAREQADQEGTAMPVTRALEYAVTATEP